MKTNEPEFFQAVIPWLVLAWFLVLFLVERIRPLRRPSQHAPHRYAVNAATTALALGTAAITVGPAMNGLMAWTVPYRMGVLHWVSLPRPLALICGVVLLDLSFYYWHRLNHVWPVLWRFHNVHHIDPDLDSTTSFRFHFGEIAYSCVFRVVQIALIGPSVLCLVVFQGAFVAATLFHHCNVGLPLGLERVLNKVFVTPRMHGIHHSTIRDETNSNYSVIFCWWDLLHRSLRLNVPQSQLRIGVAAYTSEDNTIRFLMRLPFVRQRDHWRAPDGSPSHVRQPALRGPRRRLAG